ERRRRKSNNKKKARYCFREKSNQQSKRDTDKHKSKNLKKKNETKTDPARVTAAINNKQPTITKTQKFFLTCTQNLTTWNILQCGKKTAAANWEPRISATQKEAQPNYRPADHLNANVSTNEDYDDRLEEKSSNAPLSEAPAREDPRHLRGQNLGVHYKKGITAKREAAKLRPTDVGVVDVAILLGFIR
ncbi:hypothetical protein CUMW_038410, partial [Citrus unshiu]